MLPKCNATMLLIMIRTSTAFQIGKMLLQPWKTAATTCIYIFGFWNELTVWLTENPGSPNQSTHTLTWKSEKIKNRFRTVCTAETALCSLESMTSTGRVSWSWAELRPGTPAGFCLFLFLEPAALSYLTCSHVDIFGAWNFQPFSFSVQVQPPRQARPTILIGPGRKCKDLSICLKLEGNQIFESFLKME